MPALRLSLLLCLCFVFLATAPLAGQRAEPLDLATLDALEALERAQVAEPVRLTESMGVAPAARLDDVTVAAPERLAALRAGNAAEPLTPVNGFARPVLQPIDFGALAEDGGGFSRVARSVMANGDQVVAASLEVDGAWRLRLHLRDLRLPEGTRLLVHGDGDEAVVFDVGDAEEFWSPSIGGERIHLEVRVPAASTGDLGLRVDQVLQMFELGIDGAPLVGEERAVSTGCLRDASCYGPSRFGPIDFARRAIAFIVAVRDGQSFTCTGGLINDLDQATTIPYLVTAHHCFETASDAASAEFFFDYRSSQCNGAFPNLGTLPRVVSSTLVATSPASDHSLARLSAFPDNQRVLLGWDARANVIPPGTTLYRISHPMGFSQAYSETAVTSASGCRDPQEFVSQQRGLGGVLGGSSGSPIMTSDGFIVGQLAGSCGPEPAEGCSPNNIYQDGRLSASYSRMGAVLQPRNGAPCIPTGTTLCIDDAPNDRRFEARVVWNTAQGGGGQGQGRAIGLKSLGVGAGGLFWFFGQNNPELLVKVLNACVINGHYWAFFSAGTNIAFTLQIRDTDTGLIWSRSNGDRSDAAPVADILAFPCS